MAITGDAGGSWWVQFSGLHWERINPNSDISPTTEITIDEDAPWKLFSKSLRPEDLAEKIQVDGDQRLGKAAIEMVSFMV